MDCGIGSWCAPLGSAPAAAAEETLMRACPSSKTSCPGLAAGGAGFGALVVLALILSSAACSGTSAGLEIPDEDAAAGGSGGQLATGGSNGGPGSGGSIGAGGHA